MANASRSPIAGSSSKARELQSTGETAHQEDVFTSEAGVHGVAGGEAMLRELDGSVRCLTVREAALVQGFPQTYEFPGPRSRVMGVIGNGVAVRVAAKLGSTLRSHTGL
jgi:DNA (cytosine-5)-methyltransferase 1